MNMGTDGETTLTDMANEFNADLTLDDFPDLPEFINGPAGDYVCQIPSMKIETYEKDGERKSRVRLIYQIAQVNSVVGDEPEPAIGSLFSETFGAGSGMTYLKRRMKQLLPDISGVSLGEMCDYVTKVYTSQVCVNVVLTVKSKDGYENINIKTARPVPFVDIPNALNGSDNGSDN